MRWWAFANLVFSSAGLAAAIYNHVDTLVVAGVVATTGWLFLTLKGDQ